MKPLTLASTVAALVLLVEGRTAGQLEAQKTELDPGFLIKTAEVKRQFVRGESERRLAFAKHAGTFRDWQARGKEKLAELLQVGSVKPGVVKELRQTTVQGVRKIGRASCRERV